MTGEESSRTHGNKRWHPAKVMRGHQVASQASEHYPKGTIALQLPHFRQHGLALEGFFNGTLNISVHPAVAIRRHPEFTFKHIEWTQHHPPETFSFARCQLRFKNREYDAYIYYPHPETKARHFKDASLIEILAPKIDGIEYGDTVEIAVDPHEFEIRSA